MTTRSEAARRVLSISAWALLFCVILGLVLSEPPLSDWVKSRPAGSIAHFILLTFPIITGVAALSTWGAALWHAVGDTGRQGVPRWLLITILILGNFVASFFYYFLSVHWRHRGTSA